MLCLRYSLILHSFTSLFSYADLRTSVAFHMNNAFSFAHGRCKPPLFTASPRCILSTILFLHYAGWVAFLLLYRFSFCTPACCVCICICSAFFAPVKSFPLPSARGSRHRLTRLCILHFILPRTRYSLLITTPAVCIRSAIPADPQQGRSGHKTFHLDSGTPLAMIRQTTLLTVGAISCICRVIWTP